MIHPLFSTLLSALLALLAPLANRYEFTELHMGMPVRMVVHAPEESVARRAARAGFDRIAGLEDVFSDYRSGSELRQLGRRAGHERWTPVSQPLFRVLRVARKVAAASAGAFDPTIGPLVALWRSSRQSGRLPTTQALDSARALVGWRRLELDTAAAAVRLLRAGIRLDLGGVAKGYILGEALAELRRHGVTAALIEAGGDIAVGDPPAGREGWDIAVEGLHPGPLSNTAIATSGTGEQFVEIDGVRYAHIVDPRSGLGLTTPCQATVIGPDPATADALATALAVLGPAAVDRLLALFPGYRASIIELPHWELKQIRR
jgi:thiamine biosynthesis lipoprotein